MVYKEFIERTEERLRNIYAREEGRAIAVRLLQHRCGLSSYEHIVEPLGRIPDEKLVLLQRDAEQLAAARPLQYVLGFEEFCGHRFLVKEGVLIPRPETEELVKWVEEEVYKKSAKDENLANGNKYQAANTQKRNLSGKEIRLLDAACGSGCIGISLFCALPDAEVFLCDISPDALEVTAENIPEICREEIGRGQTGIPIPFYGDLLAGPLSQNIIEHSSLDIIISNPPYIRESERALMHKNILDYEPAMALFVPDDDPLIFYRALANWGIELLQPGGQLFLEINESLGRQTVEMLSSYGYTDISIRSDLNGRERMVRAVAPARLLPLG